MNVKNENGAPIAYEDPVMTTGPHSLNTNDIIDLTEINDCEEIYDVSAAISNNSSHLQQPVSSPSSRVQTSNNSSENDSCNAHSESMDDSICILFEKIQPAPEVVVVNEVIVDGRGQNQSTNTVIDGREQNQSANISSTSSHVSPIILGSYNDGQILAQEIRRQTDSFITDFQHIPPLFPEILSESSTSPYQPINLSMDYNIADYQPASRPSCKYALRSCNVPQQTVIRRLPPVINQVPLDLSDSKTVPENAPEQGSELKNSNVPIKVPKIQCGICLDGPDEIAASGRNFTSTNCGHVFCNTCIKTSMKNAAKCPKCRKKITSRSIHPLYL